MYIDYYDSSLLGRLLMKSDGGSLMGLYLGGQDEFFEKKRGEGLVLREDLEIFGQLREWLDRYFAGERPDVSELALALNGTKFQQEVWEILVRIPYGMLITYGEIAAMMAKKMGLAKMSAQAVGGAVGSNPISIIVPCHRVVGANGSLTGYASGLDMKVRLLEHEGIDIESK